MPQFTGSLVISGSDNTLADIAPDHRRRIETGCGFGFTKDIKIYSWSKTVYKELSDRIGVYLVKTEDNKVIYVGEANGEKGGLTGRHKTHEKNDLFELFDAKYLEIYYCDKDGLDDPGQVAMLERYLILVIQPILNNDIKQDLASELSIFEKLVKKVRIITAGGNIDPKDEEQLNRITEYVLEIEQRQERIEKVIKEKKVSKLKALEKGVAWGMEEENKYLKVMSGLLQKKNEILEDTKKFVRVKKPKKASSSWFNNVAYINQLYELHKEAEDKKTKL